MPKSIKKDTPKKKTYTKPTVALKHKRIMRKIAENGGNFRKGIKKAGYSQDYADNPQKLLRTKTWHELMEEFIPDDKILRVLEEQLSAYRVLPETKFNSREELPDNDARLKAVDISAKMKGKYAPQLIKITKDKFEDWTPTQLQKYAETGEIPLQFRDRFEGTGES